MNYARKETNETGIPVWRKEGDNAAFIDTVRRNRFHCAMRFRAAFLAILLLSAGAVCAATEFRQLTAVKPLPMALDPAFQFRKAKLYLLDDGPGSQMRRLGANRIPGAGVARDPAVGFERAYRLYGAVTRLDQRRRYGQYYDFFWRAKKDASITIRLEYRQENLRTYTQGREITYPHALGSHQTSFAIIGDDYFNDGRVLEWRCLLLESGRIVAEERSFLWR